MAATDEQQAADSLAKATHSLTTTLAYLRPFQPMRPTLLAKAMPDSRRA